MELVPIIYNALLVVFTLLSLVIIVSLICSKVFFCGQPKNKRGIVAHNKVETDTLFRMKPSVQEKREVISIKPQAKIEKNLIDNNKVKRVSSAEWERKEYEQSFISQNISRYSIVNTAPQQRILRDDLHRKFSKMSIEYSQSA